jgi:acetolactate synthase-1/2/3 large subunit
MNDTNPPLRPPQRFANALRRHGVEFLFGQSNPPSLTLACDDIGIKQIGYRQENAGTYMADAYARAPGPTSCTSATMGTEADRHSARPGTSSVAAGPFCAVTTGTRPVTRA